MKLTAPGERDRLEGRCCRFPANPPLGLFHRDKRTLEEHEQQMQLQQQRLDASKCRWDELAKILSKVRGRVEHLSDKLQNVPLVTPISSWWHMCLIFFLLILNIFPFLFPMLLLQTEDTETELTSDSDEFVLVLLSQCEQKMQSLNEELVGNDLPAILKEMEQEEVSGYNMLCHTTMCHDTIPNGTVPHGSIPCGTIPHNTISHSNFPDDIMIPYPMIPFLTIPRLVIQFFTMSYYDTLSHSTKCHDTIPYDAMLQSAIPHNAMCHHIIAHNTIPNSTILHDAIPRSAIPCHEI